MEILLPLNLALTAAMFGVIWIVQIVHYPMFAGLNRLEFHKWHAFHSRRITYIVAPLMVGELLASFLLGLRRGDLVGWVTVLLTVGVWASTFFLSVPIHDKLGGNVEDHDRHFRHLVATNWIRTIIYTFKVLLLFSLFIP